MPLFSNSLSDPMFFCIRSITRRAVPPGNALLSKSSDFPRSSQRRLIRALRTAVSMALELKAQISIELAGLCSTWETLSRLVLNIQKMGEPFGHWLDRKDECEGKRMEVHGS